MSDDFDSSMFGIDPAELFPMVREEAQRWTKENPEHPPELSLVAGALRVGVRLGFRAGAKALEEAIREARGEGQSWH